MFKVLKAPTVQEQSDAMTYDRKCLWSFLSSCKFNITQFRISKNQNLAQVTKMANRGIDTAGSRTYARCVS